MTPKKTTVKVEYSINKMTKGMGPTGEYWDGPFKTLKAAKKKYDKIYREDVRNEKSRTFRIAKTVERLMKYP